MSDHTWALNDNGCNGCNRIMRRLRDSEDLPELAGGLVFASTERFAYLRYSAGGSQREAFRVLRGAVQIGYVAEMYADAWWPFTSVEGRLTENTVRTREHAAEIVAAHFRPRIVCLVGSTRFIDAFREAEFSRTLAGEIVLTIGCDTKSDDMLHLGLGAKERLDELHRRKIDAADELYCLNVGGYIGASTRNELRYAALIDKPVAYLETVDGAPMRAV